MKFNKEISPAKGITSERGNAVSIIAPFDNPTAGIFVMEIWKDIKGYKGAYQVSNLGKVRSLDRRVWSKSNKSMSSIKGVNRKLDGKGKDYLQITLYLKGKPKKFLVHRLIAITFILNPNNLPEVNHLNCNKMDNCVINLEWCTSLDNARHAKENGCYDNMQKGENRFNSILTDDAVRHIRRKELRNIDYCKLYGVAPSTVSCLQSDLKRWKHIKP